MKVLRKALTLGLLGATALTMTACGEETTKPDTGTGGDTVTPQLDKQLNINKTTAELVVKETVDVTVSTKDLTGEMKITASNTNVTWTDMTDAGVVTFTANAAGTTTVTFSQDGLAKSLTITITEKAVHYSLFGADGTEIALANTRSFYYALDELYATATKNDGSTIQNQYGDVVYTYSADYIWSFVNANGLTNEILPESLQTNSVGQTGWWADYRTDTNIYTQNTTNLISTEEVPIFIARQTEFNLTFRDGLSGFANDPNPQWNGWEASTYRAGISVAQYAGWADAEVTTGVFFDQFIFTYDLSGGEMKPSQNPNQPTRADIWLGSSNIVDDMLMGATFDAGSIETTKDLADGATREWYLFTEELLGVNSAGAGTRTLSEESFGTATWDKTNGVWIHDFSITLDLVFGEDVEGNFTRTISASVDYKSDVANITETEGEGETLPDDRISMVVNQGSAVESIKGYRFTYGVNYTPDHKVNARFIPDITNGGYWTGVLQESVLGYSNGEVVRNYDFLAGRSVNAGNQLGLYGCDVVGAVSKGSKTEFTFIY